MFISTSFQIFRERSPVVWMSSSLCITSFSLPAVSLSPLYLLHQGLELFDQSYQQENESQQGFTEELHIFQSLKIGHREHCVQKLPVQVTLCGMCLHMCPCRVANNCAALALAAPNYETGQGDGLGFKLLGFNSWFKESVALSVIWGPMPNLQDCC